MADNNQKLSRTLQTILSALILLNAGPAFGLNAIQRRNIQYDAVYHDPTTKKACATANPTDIGSPGSVAIPATFTTRDKLAQMLAVGTDDLALATKWVTVNHLGGIIIGIDGGTKLMKNGALAQIKAAAPVVPMIGIDEEGGGVSRLHNLDPSYIPPSAKDMGTMTTSAVAALGKDAGARLKSIGVNVDFAPVVDVIGTDAAADYAMKNRSFGSNQTNVTDKAGAFARGLLESSIVPTFKHFPGHGKTTGKNSDLQPVTTPSLTDLQKDDLIPYQTLSQISPSALMLGNLIVPGLTTDILPASLNPAAVALARQTYGFNGVIFTDDLAGAKSIRNFHTIPEAVTLAVQAGVDMPLLGNITDADVTAILDRLEADSRSGLITAAQIDTALSHIVALKNQFAPAGSAAAVPADQGGTGGTAPAGSTLAGLPPAWVPILNIAGGKLGIDPALLAGLMKVETGWDTPASFSQNPRRNTATATGPFQIIDSTARGLESSPDKWVDTLYGKDAGTGNNGKGVRSSTWPDSTIKAINNGSDTDASGKPFADGNGDGIVDRAQPEDAAIMAGALLKSMGATTTTPLGDAGDYTVSPGKVTFRTMAAHYNQGGAFSSPAGISLAEIDALTYAKNKNKVGTYMDQAMAAAADARASGLFGANATTTTTAANSCAAPCSVGATPGGPGSGTIVLDPGHVESVPSGRIIDPGSGVDVSEDTRQFETKNVWEVAQQAKTKLTALGYNVVLTKQSEADSNVTLKSRADVANAAKASLAISIHTTPSASTDAGTTVNYQRVGSGIYKGDVSARSRWASGDPTNFDYFFSSQDLQTKSQAAATKLIAAMGTDGVSTKAKIIDFASSQRGNIWTVQYFSTVPWIYSEIGAGNTDNNISADQITKYANAIVDGAKAYVPALTASAATAAATTASTVSDCGTGPVTGNRIQTALNLAWTNQADIDRIKTAQQVAHAAVGSCRGRNMQQCGQAKADHGGLIRKVDATTAYQATLTQYNPSAASDGAEWGFSDCGDFVAAVVRSSGTDPNYPVRGTSAQKPYVEAHPELYDVVQFTDTSQIQPGDWFIRNDGSSGHTFIYIGQNQFSPNEIVEASWTDYIPLLSRKFTADSSYIRVRPR